MKVLMIGPYPVEPDVINGGIEAVTSTLVPALAARADVESVTVLRFHRGEATTDHRREGPKVEVYYLPGQKRFRTITRSALDVRRARKFAARLDPDIVHGQEIGWFGEVATRCHPKCVVTVHGLPHVELHKSRRISLRDRLRVRPIENMIHRVLHRAAAVVSISQYDTEQLGSFIGGTQVRIPNPIGAEFFSLAPSRQTAPSLLYAGVLSELKNPLGIVNAFQHVHSVLPQARLRMVGAEPDPDYAAQLRDRVRSLGLADSVDVIGLVGKDRLCREITAARAVVLFSRQENSPTILAQAMAAGKPVVASRVGGVPEMVSDGQTGLLVDPDDEVGLAEAMLTLLQSQDRCLQMGRRAHELAAQRYSPHAVASQTVDVYRTVLGAAPSDRTTTAEPARPVVS